MNGDSPDDSALAPRLDEVVVPLAAVDNGRVTFVRRLGDVVLVALWRLVAGAGQGLPRLGSVVLPALQRVDATRCARSAVLKPPRAALSGRRGAGRGGGRVGGGPRGEGRAADGDALLAAVGRLGRGLAVGPEGARGDHCSPAGRWSMW